MIFWGASFVLGALASFLFFRIKQGSFAHIAQEVLHKAELESKELEVKLYREFESKQLPLVEKRQKLASLQEEAERTRTHLKKEQEKLKAQLKKHEEIEKTLEKIAAFSKEEAKDELFQRLKVEVERELGIYALARKEQIDEKSTLDAVKLVATTLSRLAPSVENESVTTLPLPNEEMKARIIGREGRNIAALEQALGVNFLVDETPQTVVISSFDAKRRYIAKCALKELISDGRIHPTRIEKAAQRARSNIEEKIVQEGEKAAEEVGIFDLHPKLVHTLGTLFFRHSLGQNLLAHSVEVAKIMSLFASELQLDVALATRIGLLHDIGKAITSAIDKSHALAGHDLALECKEKEAVAVGIGSHHNEIAPTSIEASLCSAANALSAARSGARLESSHKAVQRVAKLEEICLEYEGVEKAFALQAGKELRIIVNPETFDDATALLLAQKIASQIEDEVSYLGKIQVTVIREQRAIQYAR